MNLLCLPDPFNKAGQHPGIGGGQHICHQRHPNPVQRAHLISLFRRLGDEGRTVIVSSHVLEEVERMTDRVIAMVDGKLAAAGDFVAIRSAMTDIPYHVRITASDVRALASELLTIDHIDGATVDGGTARIATRAESAPTSRISSILVRKPTMNSRKITP